MKAHKHRPFHARSAQVLAIDEYRASRADPAPTPSPLDIRKRLVQETISAQLRQTHAEPVAVAAVFLRADGRVASVAEAIEPEQAEVFAAELELLATKLRRRAAITRPVRTANKQDGASLLRVLISIAFMAATYINPDPMLDAALSLAAQLFASSRLNRRS